MFVCKVCKKDIKDDDRSRFIKGCCFECASAKKLWGEYYERKAKLRSSQFPTNNTEVNV